MYMIIFYNIYYVILFYDFSIRSEKNLHFPLFQNKWIAIMVIFSSRIITKEDQKIVD